MKEKIIDDIDMLFRNTSVSPETTQADLEEIRDRAQEHISAIIDDML